MQAARHVEQHPVACSQKRGLTFGAKNILHAERRAGPLCPRRTWTEEGMTLLSPRNGSSASPHRKASVHMQHPASTKMCRHPLPHMRQGKIPRTGDRKTARFPPERSGKKAGGKQGRHFPGRNSLPALPRPQRAGAEDLPPEAVQRGGTMAGSVQARKLEYGAVSSLSSASSR